MKNLFAILILTAIFAVACSTSKTVMKKAPENTVAKSPNLSIVTFDKDIKTIVAARCSGSYCHHGEPSEWESYENIKKMADSGKLHKLVIETKKMPQYGKLTDEEYNIFKTWLANGANK